MANILKQEKGASPVKKEAPTGKAKVVGGAKSKPAKAAKPAAGKSIALKLANKLSPVRKGPAKKSTAKLVSGATPVLPSPGDGRSGAGTTNNQTMDQFKKMVAWYKKNKSGKGDSGKKSGNGKVSKTSKAIKK